MMREKWRKRRITTFLIAVILMIDFGITVRAADDIVDLAAMGSVKVTFREQQTNSVVSGGEMTLYPVAEAVESDGNQFYQSINGFRHGRFTQEEINDSSLAEQLAEEITDSTEGITKTIGTEGIVTYENLPVGLYLLVQTRAADGYHAVKPFMVSVPLKEGASWVYDVDAAPKMEKVTQKTPDTPKNPSKPGISKLPQTGQLNWPIPIMGIAGILLLMLGWSLRKKEVSA